MMMMTHPHLAPPTDSPATSSSSPSSFYEVNPPSPSPSPSPSQQNGPAQRKRRASGSICRKYSPASTSPSAHKETRNAGFLPSSDVASHFFTTTPFATPQRRRVGHSSESDEEDEDSQEGGPSSSAFTIIPPLPEPSDFPGPLLLPPISHLMSLAPTNNHNSDPSPLSPSPCLQQSHRHPPFPSSSSSAFPSSAAPGGDEVAPPLPYHSLLLDSFPHWPSSSSSPATSASLTARSTGTRSSATSPPDSASRVSLHPVASAGQASRPAISSPSGGGLVPMVPPADGLPPFLVGSLNSRSSSSSSSAASHAPPSSPAVKSTHDHHNNPTTAMLPSSFSEPSGTTLPTSTTATSFYASSPDLRLLHQLQQCPPHPFAGGQHASYLSPPYMPPESHVHHSTAFPASSRSATSSSPSLKSSASSSPKLGFGYNPFFSPLSSPSPPSSAPHTSPRSPASTSSSKGAFFANNTTKTKILPRLSTTSSPVMSPSSTPPSSSPFASLPSSILSCAEPQRDIESMILPSRVKRCLECGSTDTPGWRRGPQGIRTLCNACGLRYARKKAEEKARAALPRKSNIHNLLN
ncbi:white collar 2 type of transcription factor [Balamuthia mandrillaris]